MTLTPEERAALERLRTNLTQRGYMPLEEWWIKDSIEVVKLALRDYPADDHCQLTRQELIAEVERLKRGNFSDNTDGVYRYKWTSHIGRHTVYFEVIKGEIQENMGVAFSPVKRFVGATISDFSSARLEDDWTNKNDSLYQMTTLQFRRVNSTIEQRMNNPDIDTGTFHC